MSRETDRGARIAPTDSPPWNWKCVFAGHDYRHITGRDLAFDLPVECWACTRCGRIA